jgi:hypothetical protein
MTSVKIVLIISLVTGLGAFCSHHYAQQERDHETARLRKENARMRAVIALRHTLKPLTVEPAGQSAADSGVRWTTAASASSMDDGPAPSVQKRRWPVRRYSNAGQATPIAALQTMAWACDRGDVEAMARLFIIDEEARPETNAIFATIPAELRTELGSVEALAAAIIVHNGIEQPYPGTEVLALARIEPMTEGRVTLVLPGAIVSGVVFQQTAEGWKYVISKAVVEDYIARRMTPASER